MVSVPFYWLKYANHKKVIYVMFENILQTSIFVRILIFAFVSIFAINVIALLVNFGLTLFMKITRIK